MTEPEQVREQLDDPPIGVRLRLSGLWTSAVLCYIYGDIGSLYTPGWLQTMLDGKMPGLGPATQGALLGGAVFMAAPSLMVVLSLILTARAARWANIVVGGLYTIAMAATVAFSSWAFYIFMGALEIALTVSIVWQAWKWPKSSSRGAIAA